MKSHRYFIFLPISMVILYIFAATNTAIAQFEERRLIPLSDGEETFMPHDFIVFGRACKGRPPLNDPEALCSEYIGDGAYNAGIVAGVAYRHIPKSQEPEESQTATENLNRMPDLETFFEFGGSLELLTTDLTLTRYDLVMSELMWGVDKGLRDAPGTIMIPNPDFDSTMAPSETNLEMIPVSVPIIQNQEVQWVELYNTTNTDITANLFFLFSPRETNPSRANDTVEIDGISYRVLDVVDTLFGGLWELPGKSGRRPTTAFISAYRNIDFETVEDARLERIAQLVGIPIGLSPDSWESTPEIGRINTELRVVVGADVIDIPCIASPGAKHLSGGFLGRLDISPVRSNVIVINEVHNDTSTDNIDWVELKNVSTRTVQLEDWELSIVTGVGKDTDLVNLPEFELFPGEILLIVNEEPEYTPLADGIRVDSGHNYKAGATHLYSVDESFMLPNIGKFVLLLRSESDQNGEDRAIQDYAGNGFFVDTSPSFLTAFWPRVGQLPPVNIADFGENTFVSPNNSWARIRYQRDDGHHEDAWEKVGSQGGLGYAPGSDRSTSPGTPGYENDAFKTKPRDPNLRRSTSETEFTDGEIIISEIMYDNGQRGNLVQWIELYNTSRTQALNLKGWNLDIYNLPDEELAYVNMDLTLNEAVILPNQTLLIVSDRTRRADEEISTNRIYDLFRQHSKELGLVRRYSLLLNPVGFYIELTYKPANSSVEPIVMDSAGNAVLEKHRLKKIWDLPEPDPAQRRSIVRRYSNLSNGTEQESWRIASKQWTYYGDEDDLGTPGFRRGGPLPVELSSFRPELTLDGEVVIRWRTESELNNAGFNILRSKTEQGPFVKVNPSLIQGAGTTSERSIYTWTDTTTEPDVVYYYQIEDVSFVGERQTLSTRRLMGLISAANKLVTTWGRLKHIHE